MNGVSTGFKLHAKMCVLKLNKENKYNIKILTLVFNRVMNTVDFTRLS